MPKAFHAIECGAFLQSDTLMVTAGGQHAGVSILI